MALASNGDARHQPVTGRVVVIIPTLDEAQSIAAVVRSIPRPLVGRIIVADGGSRDATVLRAQEAGAEVIAAGRGYGRACLAATMAARRRRHRGVHGWRRRRRSAGHRQASASRSAPAASISSSARAHAANASREASPGTSSRRAMLAGWGMRLLYGVRYTDMCAFRAIRRDALLELGMRELTYGWNIEMQMRAARAGLRILEIPVDYRRRSGGTFKGCRAACRVPSGLACASSRRSFAFRSKPAPHPSSGERKLQRQPSNAP